MIQDNKIYGYQDLARGLMNRLEVRGAFWYKFDNGHLLIGDVGSANQPSNPDLDIVDKNSKIMVLIAELELQ